MQTLTTEHPQFAKFLERLEGPEVATSTRTRKVRSTGSVMGITLNKKAEIKIAVSPAPSLQT